MVKEEVFFITSDGKQYKTKRAAERHENEITMEQAGYTKKEVDEYLHKLKDSNRQIQIILEQKKDWRDLSPYIVKQFPETIEDFKNDVVTYQIIKFVGWGMSKDEEVIKGIRLPRLEEGEIPEEFIQYVNDLTEQDKEKNGSTFEIRLHKETDKVIKYQIIENRLSPEDKMAQGRKLSESDIREMYYDREEVYEVEGEESRWSRSMTTVVKGLDGYQYAIDWERGLTESQEDSYYNQPRKVKLEEKEITTTVIQIIDIEDEE